MQPPAGCRGCAEEDACGAVKVVVNQGEEEYFLSELKEGDFFGEMAVLESYPRSATVIALKDGTTVSEIPGRELDEYFTRDPEKIIELFRHISNRLRAATDDYNEAYAVYEQMCAGEAAPQSEAFGKRVEKLLGRVFSPGKDSISAEAQRAMEEADVSRGYSNDTVAYSANTLIFREGEPIRCLYAIHSGCVGIYANYGTPEQSLLTTLMTGKFFGEMGIVDNMPRSATAVVLEDNTTLEMIGMDDLKDLFSRNPPKVGMILQNLSYRLRRRSIEYTELCQKIKEKQGA